MSYDIFFSVFFEKQAIGFGAFTTGCKSSEKVTFLEKRKKWLVCFQSGIDEINKKSVLQKELRICMS